MNRLDVLRQQPSRVNVTKAIAVLNNDSLTFKQKHQQIQDLEDLSAGHELELFGDVYSSLHLQAVTKADIALITNTEDGE